MTTACAILVGETDFNYIVVDSAITDCEQLLQVGPGFSKVRHLKRDIWHKRDTPGWPIYLWNIRTQDKIVGYIFTFER